MISATSKITEMVHLTSTCWLKLISSWTTWSVFKTMNRLMIVETYYPAYPSKSWNNECHYLIWWDVTSLSFWGLLSTIESICGWYENPWTGNSYQTSIKILWPIARRCGRSYQNCCAQRKHVPTQLSWWSLRPTLSGHPSLVIAHPQSLKAKHQLQRTKSATLMAWRRCGRAWRTFLTTAPGFFLRPPKGRI